MKGHGLSVFKGMKIERFDAEVLGVLKNTSPGRDMVLIRVAGCNLEKTGVVAGMSGSPVYIDGKLLGAIAYAWAFGSEPIAGVTPFCQMVEFVESFDKRDAARRNEPTRASLPAPLRIGEKTYETVCIAEDPNAAGRVFEPRGSPDDALWMVPLKTPLCGSNFTQHSLNLLRERLGGADVVPVQAGSAAPHLLKECNDAPLEPGAPLSVALITGDFDLSGIGTVTHVEGDRVYGWGHPFMSNGPCELPMMSGYIHAIYPRRSVSFKMGSPIKAVGIIDADVSTCIAGWLNRKPDMLPVKMTVTQDWGNGPRTFNCDVVRQKALMPQLVYSALTNSVDMEGELPEELTAEFEARFEFDDRPPLVIRDTYSGSSVSGGRAPGALYSQVASVVQTLLSNPYRPVRIKRIECDTRLCAGRSSAEIEAIQLDSETYAPGDNLKATVFVKPFKQPVERVSVQLKLPSDLPEGSYTAYLTDDLSHARSEVRDSPILSSPRTVDQVFEALRAQTAGKRTHLVIRVPVKDVGVALDGQALPNLPGSMVEMLANSKRTGVQTMHGALVGRIRTEWVLQGSQSVKFAVVKNKRLTAQP